MTEKAMHSKYHSIENFRLIIQDIKYMYPDNLPILDFTGTVKLHGTNAGIGYDGTNMWCQSRTNIINIKSDNAGFSFFVEKNRDYILDIIKLITDKYMINYSTHNIIIFGEWCGEGIQKNVGISKFPKMFFIFDVKVVCIENQKLNYYINSKFEEIKSNEEHRIYNIYEFKTYNISIDFNDLDKAQCDLIKLVEEVENDCPITRALGDSGIGEGIVFKHYYENGTRCVFKLKGEKHSVTKDIDKVSIKVHDQSLLEFVKNTVTENRFTQCIEYLYKLDPSLPTYNKAPQMSDIKYIIEWIIDDIIKEEKDTIFKNNYEYKVLKSEIARVTVQLFKRLI